MKYTEEQLSEMAKECMLAKQAGDFRYMQLVMEMCFRTGMSASAVERNIAKMAEGAE